VKNLGIYLSWIVVKDFAAAVEFYKQTVGLELKEYHPDMGWAEFSGPGGSVLGIAQENPQEAVKAGGNAVITVAVENIQQACEEFLQKGVTLVGEILEIPGHVKMQTFLDKDGNTLQLVQTLG